MQLISMVMEESCFGIRDFGEGDVRNPKQYEALVFLFFNIGFLFFDLSSPFFFFFWV